MGEAFIKRRGGIDVSDANAGVADVLQGKTFYAGDDSDIKTGTIQSLGAATYIPKTTDQTIAAGRYLSGVQTIKGDANLVATNIKSGVSIFGVNGSLSDLTNTVTLSSNFAWDGSNNFVATFSVPNIAPANMISLYMSSDYVIGISTGIWGDNRKAVFMNTDVSQCTNWNSSATSTYVKLTIYKDYLNKFGLTTSSPSFPATLRIEYKTL